MTMKPSAMSYVIVFDRKTKAYNGYCPSMKAVNFWDKDKDKVKELVEDGIDLYLKQNPTFLNKFNVKEV